MRKILMLPAIALVVGAMTVSASSRASANTLTFQNVTFSTADLGSGHLRFTISNALNANDNWTGVHYLEAFAFGTIGTFTSASLANWAYDPGGLSNGSTIGCTGNGNGACFYQSSTPITLTNNMVFDIFFTGGTTNFGLPTLKIDFWANSSQHKSTGDLLSQSVALSIPSRVDIPPTPLPGALPLFATGLGALGLLGWRRKRKAQATA